MCMCVFALGKVGRGGGGGGGDVYGWRKVGSEAFLQEKKKTICNLYIITFPKLT